jgi:hypothetical protein
MSIEKTPLTDEFLCSFEYLPLGVAIKHVEAHGYRALPIEAKGNAEGRQWVKENIPLLDRTHTGPKYIRGDFWKAWLGWLNDGAVLCADCSWPVETRFLAACVDDNPSARQWEGPYPLYDLASLRLAAGFDPLAAEDRLPHELPVHNPLADALQSARLLVETLGILRKRWADE